MEQSIRTFLSAYGDRVRTARQNADMTQLELARLIPCSQAIISHIEQGYMLPPPHIYIALQEILEI